jgi:[acyl-carrier-protein] S-malonyltransferase
MEGIMNTAFLFPGQGAQVAGMGADIAAEFPAAEKIFKKANDVLGYDLRKLCFEGPQEQLNATAVSQPAIFTTSIAILEVLRENNKTKSLIPQVTAGLSLGEYTALYAAGVISFEDGLKLVHKRGHAMQEAADASRGSMVSILGLDEDTVQALCNEAAQGQLLVPANYNCPGQIVITGEIEACQRAVELAPKYNAIKAIPLAVAGAFHSAIMKPAADALAKAIAQTNLNAPKNIKVIANIDTQYYTSVEQIGTGLVKQLVEPILWQKCMEKLLADGFTDFYEIGPGRVLTGLMKKIDRKAKVNNISNAQSLKDLIG